MTIHSDSSVAPTLELRQEVRDKVEKYLEDTFENIHRKVGQTARFVCNHPITASVLMELPGSHLAWVINNSPMVMDPSRVFYYKGNIDVTDLSPSDTGVYECVVKWASGNTHDNVTVGVYSLQVTAASTTRYIFEYEPLKLVCNSEGLGRLFPAATRQWLFGKAAFTLLPSVLAENESAEVIHKIRKNQTGVWQCQVTHSRTGRVWDTAWLNVTVMDHPSFIALWYRQMADHTGLVFSALGLIIVISFLIFLYSAYQIKNREDEADKEFAKERSGWEDLLSGFVEKGTITVDDFPEPKEGEGEESGEEEDGEEAEEAGGISEEGEEEGGEDVSGNAGRMTWKSGRKAWQSGRNTLKSGRTDHNTSHGDAHGNIITNTARVFLKHQRNRRRYESARDESYIQPDAPSYESHRKTPRAYSTVQRMLSKSRSLKDREARKPKLYRALTVEAAFHWLFKNSPDMNKIDSLIKANADFSLADLNYNAAEALVPTYPGVSSYSHERDDSKSKKRLHVSFGLEEPGVPCPMDISPSHSISRAITPASTSTRNFPRSLLPPTWLSKTASPTAHVCNVSTPGLELNTFRKNFKYSPLSQDEEEWV